MRFAWIRACHGVEGAGLLSFSELLGFGERCRSLLDQGGKRSGGERVIMSGSVVRCFSASARN
jgi:hypothetical protein